MDKITLGIICGLVAGILDVLIMIPLSYETKRKQIEAMSSAFIERFMIGFLIPTTALPIHPVTTGLFLGTVLSIPSALITRVYVPIIGIGALEGIIVGFVAKMVAG